MMQYGEGILAGDTYYIHFNYGKIQGTFAVLANKKINVNLTNDADLPKGFLEKFWPLVLIDLQSRYRASHPMAYTDALVSAVVQRIGDEPYTIGAVVDAVMDALPEDDDASKPARGLVELLLKDVVPELPALYEQVVEYRRFLDDLEAGAITIGGTSVGIVDPEAKRSLDEETYRALVAGTESSEFELNFPRPVAAWEGVLLRAGYLKEIVEDEIFGKVPVYAKKQVAAAPA